MLEVLILQYVTQGVGTVVKSSSGSWHILRWSWCGRLMLLCVLLLLRTRAFQREERNLAAFLATPTDKWVASTYDVSHMIIIPPPSPHPLFRPLTPLPLIALQLDGPLYAVVVSLFIHTLDQWREKRLMFMRRLLVLAHARNSSSSPVKRSENVSQYCFNVVLQCLPCDTLVLPL